MQHPEWYPVMYPKPARSARHRRTAQPSLVPSPLSRTRKEGVWLNVYRARVARATYSERQSDARMKSHDCAGMNRMHINDCACAFVRNNTLGAQ